MADDANMKGHVATYNKVTGMMYWGAIGVAVLVALVIWLIA
jgi:hypothetical protein